MLRAIILLILVMTPGWSLSAQLTTISGTGKDFAGDSIAFFRYREPLFTIRYPEARAYVASDGSFRFSIATKTTECLYAELGPYLAYFFVEPGKSYELTLPAVSGISGEWKTNPYYRKALYLLSVTCTGCTGKGLNQAIRDFNLQYEPFHDKQVLRYYSPAYSRAKLDSFIRANPVPPDLSDPSYYRRYRSYKLGVLEFTVNAYNTDSLIAGYFLGKKVDFGLPPYAGLFRLVFNDYYQHLSMENRFHGIYRVFGRLSYDSLKAYLHPDVVMQNDTLFETVLLEEIYQSFYAGDFPREKMIAFADTVRSRTKIPVIEDMAGFMIRKFTSLQPGSPAPGFRLRDPDGVSHALSDYRGKYVCLGFCDTQSMGCLKEFEYLKVMAARYKAYLTVVTIIPSGNPEDVKRFMEENQINWTVLLAGDGDDVLREYDVRAFPVFYLIDREGKMVRSPAANPSEGLDQVLFRVMKERGEI